MAASDQHHDHTDRTTPSPELLIQALGENGLRVSAFLKRRFAINLLDIEIKREFEEVVQIINQSRIKEPYKVIFINQIIKPATFAILIRAIPQATRTKIELLLNPQNGLKPKAMKQLYDEVKDLLKKLDIEEELHNFILDDFIKPEYKRLKTILEA